MAYRRTEKVIARLEDKRHSILHAASQLAVRDGLDFTMDDVADRVGVAVGTIYLHWPDRTELGAAVIAGRLDSDIAAMARAAARQRPLNALASTLAVYIHRTRETPDLAPSITTAPAYRVPMIRAFEDAIAAAVGGKDAGTLALAVYGALNAVLLEGGLRRGSGRKAEQVALSMALRAIGVTSAAAASMAEAAISGAT